MNMRIGIVKALVDRFQARFGSGKKIPIKVKKQDVDKRKKPKRSLLENILKWLPRINLRKSSKVQSSKIHDLDLSPIERSAKKAVAIALNRDQDFITFNKISDNLKIKNGWKLSIEHQINELSDADLKSLINVSALDIKGYDREIMREILSKARDEVEERDLLTEDKLIHLDQLILYLNTNILHIDKKDIVNFGKGKVNVVQLIKYRDDKGIEKTAIFKQESSSLGRVSLMIEQHFGTAVASGIPPGIDAHLSYRAVASSVVDKMMYQNQRISVKTEFVIVNGMRGVLMEKAKGNNPKVKKVIKEVIDIEKYPLLKYFFHQSIRGGKKLSPAEKKLIAAHLHYRSVQIVKDKNGKSQLIGTRNDIKNFTQKNYDTICEGLMRLQVKDIITGECDRHPQNYFIDHDGLVTGIDEDCCFGVNAIPAGDVRGQKPLFKFVVPVGPNNSSLMLRMPSVITQKTYDDIERLLDHWEDLQEELAPYISPEEIEATIVRLEKLSAHINNPEKCLVVANKEELLSENAMSRMTTNNSYYIREMMVYEKNKRNWNYMRAFRED